MTDAVIEQAIDVEEMNWVPAHKLACLIAFVSSAVNQTLFSSKH